MKVMKRSAVSFDTDVNRLHPAFHAISWNNTYDLFIRPITPIQANETIQEAEKRMDQFVRDMMDALLKFLEEKKVGGD